MWIFVFIRTFDCNLIREDMSRLKYTTMFLKEVMRMHSPVPFISRWLTKPMILDGVEIPENVTVDIFIHCINHHPDVWPDHMVIWSSFTLTHLHGMSILDHVISDPITGYVKPLITRYLILSYSTPIFDHMTSDPIIFIIIVCHSLVTSYHMARQFDNTCITIMVL